jgi:hypothetical protein
MTCELRVYNLETKKKQSFVCDEDNAGRMVENDHAAKASAEYADASGKKFTVDWTKERLVSFRRGN